MKTIIKKLFFFIIINITGSEKKSFSPPIITIFPTMSAFREIPITFIPPTTPIFYTTPKMEKNNSFSPSNKSDFNDSNKSNDSIKKNIEFILKEDENKFKLDNHSVSKFSLENNPISNDFIKKNTAFSLEETEKKLNSLIEESKKTYNLIDPFESFKEYFFKFKEINKKEKNRAINLFIQKVNYFLYDPESPINEVNISYRYIIDFLKNKNFENIDLFQKQIEFFLEKLKDGDDKGLYKLLQLKKNIYLSGLNKLLSPKIINLLDIKINNKISGFIVKTYKIKKEDYTIEIIKIFKNIIIKIVYLDGKIEEIIHPKKDSNNNYLNNDGKIICNKKDFKKFIDI